MRRRLAGFACVRARARTPHGWRERVRLGTTGRRPGPRLRVCAGRPQPEQRSRGCSQQAADIAAAHESLVRHTDIWHTYTYLSSLSAYFYTEFSFSIMYFMNSLLIYQNFYAKFIYLYRFPLQCFNLCIHSYKIYVEKKAYILKCGKESPQKQKMWKRKATKMWKRNATKNVEKNDHKKI